MYFKKCFIANFICCPIKIKAKKVGVYVQWASKPLTISTLSNTLLIQIYCKKLKKILHLTSHDNIRIIPETIFLKNPE